MENMVDETKKYETFNMQRLLIISCGNEHFNPYGERVGGCIYSLSENQTSICLNPT
jgi:hypothetical protein